MADVTPIRTRGRDGAASSCSRGQGARCPAAPAPRPREAAFAPLPRPGLPHRRVEAWKYTDLRALLREAAPLAPAPDAGRAWPRLPTGRPARRRRRAAHRHRRRPPRAAAVGLSAACRPASRPSASPTRWPRAIRWSPAASGRVARRRRRSGARAQRRLHAATASSSASRQGASRRQPIARALRDARRHAGGDLHARPAGRSRTAPA